MQDMKANKTLVIEWVAPRPGVTLAYRVNEGVPEVQSSGVRGAGCARAPTAPATAATALEPQIHRRYTRTTRTQHRGTNTHSYIHANSFFNISNNVYKTRLYVLTSSAVICAP